MSEYSVTEVYKGINIRKCNRVILRFGVADYKKIIDECELTGLSIQKLLSYSGMPCDRCKDTSTNVYDSEGEIIKVRKGLLHVPQSSGINIIQKEKRRNDKSDRNSQKNK